MSDSIYLVRIRYKSGKHEDFWCKDFKVSPGELSWSTATDPDTGDNKHPLMIGMGEDIESIWQISMRHVENERE